jgi:hypothetical protein
MEYKFQVVHQVLIQLLMLVEVVQEVTFRRLALVALERVVKYLIQPAGLVTAEDILQ